MNKETFYRLITSAERADRTKTLYQVRALEGGFPAEFADELMKAMRHPDAGIREDSVALVNSVVYTCDEGSSRRFFGELLRLAQEDPSAHVRAQSIEAACQYQFTEKQMPIFEPHGHRMLALVEQALDDKDWYLRHVAADYLWAFERWKPGEIISRLKRLMEEEPDPQVRLGAVRSLRQLRHLDGVSELLLEIAARDPDQTVRDDAANG